MRAIPRARHVLALGLVTAALAGCENSIPTATGGGLFPPGSTLASLQVAVPASDFVSADTVYEYNDVRNVPYLVVAQDFDGAMTAHALARFGEFPSAVVYSTPDGERHEENYTITSARVTATVDSAASAAPGGATLRLWALAQPFDSATVTWTQAAEGTPWQQPGGTPGALLAEATWVPGDTTVVGDTLVWEVKDPTVLDQMQQAGTMRFLVTSATEQARLVISHLDLAALVRPVSTPDTTVTVLPEEETQTFLVTPAPPTAPGVLRVGGITDARTVLRLDLDQLVPACAEPSTTPDCGVIPLRDVTLNRALLEFTAVPVPDGWRPTQPTTMGLQQVVQPELGSVAPLGNPLASPAAASASLFDGPGGGDFSLDVTSALLALYASDTTEVTVAILAPPGTPQVGYAWFTDTPQLRLIYTLPLRPTLP